MNDKKRFDTSVLIAGAGPVGKTIACELARYGIAHRIVDLANGPKDISKALILHSRTQEVQALMGLLPESQAAGKPLQQLEMHAYGEKLASMTAGVDSPYPHALILGQDRTERVLESHLNRLGGRVEWNTSLAGFTQDDSGVTATLRHADGGDETVSAQYIVGCEGSNSLVRRTLGLTFEGARYEGEQFIQADCKIRWTLPSGMSYLFLTSDGYMMVIEMPDDYVRIFISLPDSDPEAQKQVTATNAAVEDKDHEPRLDEIRQNLLRLTGADAELSDPVWLARYRTSHRYANEFRKGDAFIAGDAAHVHVPLGGQGMNTGIQDAFNLAWKLAYVVRGWASENLLDTYSQERHPVAKALIEGTDKGYTTILHPSELAQNLVRRIGPFVMRQGFMQSKLQNVLEEMQVAYRNTALAADFGGSRGPAAGERAPDAVCVRLSDCRTTNIFELLAGTHWLLLLFSGVGSSAASLKELDAIRESVLAAHAGVVRAFVIVAASSAPALDTDPTSVLMDGERFVHEKYSVQQLPCIYLVRPDDYIGFRGTIGDRDRLDEYLHLFLRSS